MQKLQLFPILKKPLILDSLKSTDLNVTLVHPSGSPSYDSDQSQNNPSCCLRICSSSRTCQWCGRTRSRPGWRQAGWSSPGQRRRCCCRVDCWPPGRRCRQLPMGWSILWHAHLNMGYRCSTMYWILVLLCLYVGRKRCEIRGEH